MRGLGPALHGQVFDSPNPSREQLEQFKCVRSILSLVWLPLKPEFDVQDEERAPSRIWQACLEYIARLDGCQGLYWGVDFETSEPSLLLVAAWEDGLAWHRFQRSAGLMLMADMLRGRPLNRTVCLDALDAYRVENIAGKLIEVVFLSASSDAEKIKIEEGLHTLHSLAAQSSGAVSYVHSTERFALRNLPSPPGSDYGDIQPATVASIGIWDKKEYYVNARDDSLRATATWLMSQASDFRRYSAKLRTATTPTLEPLPTNAGIRPRNTADLVMTPQVRQSPNAAYYHDYTGPPAFRRVGEMNEFSEIDNRPAWSEPHCPREVVDTFQLNFRVPYSTSSLILPSDLGNELEHLRTEVESMDGCRAVEYAAVFLPKHGDGVSAQVSSWEQRADVIQVLIFWVLGSEQLSTKRHNARQLIAEVVRRIPSLVAPPRVVSFPALRGLFLPSNMTYPDPLLEITSFYVPNKAPERYLFQKAYDEYARTNKLSPMHLSVREEVDRVNDNLGGWADGVIRQDTGREIACFTSVRWWRSAKQAVSWYEDFGRYLREDPTAYERLGIRVDVLALIATGGADSIFLKPLNLPEVQRWFPIIAPP
ncbi:hypothetical protein GQ53DRAFT_841042 [Thozetella sp. PMI_491]|nr:hypothetical protein GQ53DRAFT_841042 [Thozetella sp. PMI_491]